MLTAFFLTLSFSPAYAVTAAPARVSQDEVLSRFASGRTPDPLALIGAPDQDAYSEAGTGRWKPVLYIPHGQADGAYDPAGLCPDQDCHALEFRRPTPHPAFANIYRWEGLNGRVDAAPREPDSWRFNGNWGSQQDSRRHPPDHDDLAEHLQGETAIIVSYRRVIAQYGDGDSRARGKPADASMTGYCRMAGELLLCRVFTETYSRTKPRGSPYHMHWRYAPSHIIGYHKQRPAAPPALDVPSTAQVEPF